jgi:hypothetical protein
MKYIIIILLLLGLGCTTYNYYVLPKEDISVWTLDDLADEEEDE